jgi:hypothetical protein
MRSITSAATALSTRRLPKEMRRLLTVKDRFFPSFQVFWSYLRSKFPFL